MTQPEQGFTLIELVVVLFILGLVSILVIPRLPSTAASDLDRSADAVAALLRGVDQEAVVTKKTFRLRVVPGSGDLTLRERRGDEFLPPGDPLLARSPLRGETVIEEVRTGSLGGVRQGEVLIDIGPGGIGDFIALYLAAEGGYQKTVMAFPLSGKVAVYDGYRENPL